MPSRLEVIGEVARYLQERYDRSVKIQKEIERLSKANELEKVQSILSTASYIEDSKSRFTYKELETLLKGVVNKSSLYYALIISNQVHLKKQEQVDTLLEKGIAIQFMKNAKVATAVKFFYDPGVLYQAAMSAYAPPEIVIQPYRPPVVEGTTVQVTYGNEPTGLVQPLPVECEREHCENPKHHPWVTKIQAFIEDNYLYEGSVFSNRRDKYPKWTDVLSYVLTFAAENLEGSPAWERKQSSSN